MKTEFLVWCRRGDSPSTNNFNNLHPFGCVFLHSNAPYLHPNELLRENERSKILLRSIYCARIGLTGLYIVLLWNWL